MLLNKKLKAMAMSGVMLLSLTACGITDELNIPKSIGNLTWDHSMELSYATEFSVDYYAAEGADAQYKLFSIDGDGQYLLVPEGEKAPEDIDKKITVLSEPSNIYLVATQTMDMFATIEGLDNVRFSSLQQDDWYVSEALVRMDKGLMEYAGHYSAPDYELILSKGCDLAIENTMIYHTPEVKEQLESFDIPVMVDHSSYEQHPFGRMEWVKLYGALLSKEDMATQAFDEQVAKYESLHQGDEGEANNVKDNCPTVAFFYVAANGSIKVRKSADYIPKMIEMAGGKYIFDNLGDKDSSASSTVNMQMEEFYAQAKDADYIIYNSTIDGEISTLDDLLEKNNLFANMEAVKQGHVYCTSQNVYQSPMETGTVIEDINKMLNYNENTKNNEMKYLIKLD